MNTEGGALDFESTLNNEQFIGAINEAERRVKGFSESTVTGGKKIDSAFQNLQQRIALSKDLIAGTEADIKKLNAELSNMSPGAAKVGLQAEAKAASQALAEEKANLKQLEEQTKATSMAHVTLRTRLRQMKEALVEMEAAGLRDTAKYKALRTEFANLTDAMGDAQAQGKILGSDERLMQGAISGFTGIAGAASAAQGAIGLFSGENENLQRVMLKVQSLMAITIGMQQVEQALNKDSAFRLVYLSKAKEMLAAATNRLSISLGISTVAAKALMATLTLGLSVAVTAAIAIFSRLIKKQQEAKKFQEELKNTNLEAAKSISEDVGTIKSYLSVADNYNASLETRNKAIKKVKDLMPGYNGYIDEEGKLIDNSATALKNYIAQLQAVEAMKLLIKQNAEDEAKKIDIQGGELTNKKTGGFITQTILHGGNVAAGAAAMTPTWLEEQDKELKIIDARIEERNKKIVDIISKAGIPDEKGDIDKKEYDARKDLQKGLVDMQNETNDLLLDARKDNYLKTLSEIDKEHKEQIQKVKDFQREVIEKYNEAHKADNGFKALGKTDADLGKSIFVIDPEMSKQLTDAQAALDKAYAQKKVKVTQDAAAEVKKIMQGVLDDAKNKQEQELAAVRDKYTKIREELLKNEKAITVEQEADLKAAQNKEETQIKDSWILKNSKAFVKLFGDVDDMTTKALQKAIEEAKKLVEGAADSLDPEDLKTYVDAIEDAEKEVAERNPFTALKNAFDDLSKAMEMPAGEERAAAISKSLNDVYNSAYNAGEMIGAMGDAISDLGTSLNSEELSDLGNAFSDIAGNIQAAMEGFKSGGWIGAIIAGVADLIPKLIEDQNKSRDRGQDMVIKKLTEELNVLIKTYNRLGDAIRNALGTSAYDLQKDQITNLQEQQDYYQQLIEIEKTKKKPDKDKISEYESAYEEAADNIADIQQNILDGILQTNVKDFAQEMSDALVSAFQNGEDAAKAFDTTVNDMIRNVVINSMKVNVIERALKPLLDRVAKAMSDYTLSETELHDLLAFTDVRIKDNLLRVISGYTDILNRLGLGDETEDTSLTGNIKGVTEQTASVLAGTLNAMRINQVEGTNIIRQQLMHLAEIASNTRYLQSIDSKLSALNADPLRAQGLNG